MKKPSLRNLIDMVSAFLWEGICGRYLAVGLMLALPFTVGATNHYFIYNSGNWNANANWTTSSGGATTNGVPDITLDSAVRAYLANSACAATINSQVPTNYLIIIQNGASVTEQAGGVMVCSNYLTMNGPSTLNIQDGTWTQASSSGRMIMGNAVNDNPTFNQTGGVMTVQGPWLIGAASNAVGTVSISGGRFNYSGGNADLGGYTAYSTGIINLSGTGILASSNSIIFGASANSIGIFNQTGGTYQSLIGAGWTLGSVASASGSYSISGGLLDMKSVGSSSVIVGTGGVAKFQVTGNWDNGANTNINIGGNLTLNTTNCTLAYVFNASGIEEINVGGTANLTNSTLQVGGSVTASGTYNLLTATNITTNNMVVTMLPGIQLTSLQVVAGGNGQILQATVAPTVAYPLVWTAGNGNWDSVSTNWTQNGSLTTYSDANLVRFDDTPDGSGPFVVTITNATVSPFGITVSNNAKAYALEGNPIAGSAALIKQGTGTVAFGGNNTFSGGTLISAGTVQIGDGTNAGTLGTGPITNNATLAANTGTNNATLSTAISGTGTFVQNGAGTFTLSGANTYTGNTVVNAGTLAIGGAGSLNGGNYAGNITNNGVFNYAGSGAQTLSGVISGSGVVSNSSANILTLTGNSTYTGPLVVAAGTVTVSAIGNVGVSGPVGAGSAGVYTNAPIQLFNNTLKTLQYTGPGETNNRSIYISQQIAANQYATLDASGSGPLVFNSATNIVMAVANSTIGDSPLTLTGSNTGDNTLAGDIQDGLSKYLAVVKQGTGTWALTGPKNFHGRVDVAGGTLKFDSLANAGTACALGLATQLYISATASGYAISLTNGAVLQYTGTGASASDRIIGMTGSGTLSDGTAGGSLTLNGGVVNLNDNANTLTLAGSGNSTIAGPITDNYLSLGITKTGSGTWTLSGTSTFYQPLVVSNGTLNVALPQTASDGVTVEDGATLEVSVSGANQLSVSSALVLGSTTGGSLTFSGLSSLTTAPVNASAGSLVLNGNCLVNIAGGTFSAGQTYPLITFGSISGAGRLTLGSKPSHLAATIVTNVNGSEIDLVVSGYYSDEWAAGTGNWDYTSQNWKVNGSPATFADSDSVVFDDTPVGAGPFTVTVTPASVLPGSMTFNNSKTYKIEGNPVAGTVSLTMNGSGLVAFGATNSFSGGTVINSGTVQMGDGSNAGTLGGGAITDDGTLAVNGGANASALDNSISGGGLLVMNGSGVLAISATNNFSGGTVINAGTVQAGNGNALGTGNVTNNGVLALNDFAASDTLANNVSGSGGVSLTGPALITFTGNNSYMGSTIVSAGALLLSGPTELGNSSLVVVTNNASVGLNDGVTITNNLSLAGAGLNNVGALQTYSGNAVWGGGVHIATGGTRLGVNIGGSSLTVSGVIDSGGQLYTNGAAFNIRCSTTNQTVILTASNTYLGDTVVNAGILQLAGGDNRLPVASILDLGINSGGGVPGFLDLNGFNQTVGGVQLFQPGASTASAVENTFGTLCTLTVNSTTNTVFEGYLNGNLNLIKTGPASFTLASTANAQSGSTTINGGALLIDGDNGTSPVSVNNNGTLGGSGQMEGLVTVNAGGALSAGDTNNLATLTLNGGLALSGNVVVKVNKDLSPAQTNDQFNVTGSLANNGVGTLTVENVGVTDLAVGDTFQVFNRALTNGGALSIAGPAGMLFANHLATDGTISVLSLSSTPPGFPAHALTVSGGTASLTATGAIGTPFTLWASTNLALKPVTNTWTKLTNGTISASPFIISDPGAITNRQRFYLFSTP